MHEVKSREYVKERKKLNHLMTQQFVLFLLFFVTGTLLSSMFFPPKKSFMRGYLVLKRRLKSPQTIRFERTSEIRRGHHRNRRIAHHLHRNCLTYDGMWRMNAAVVSRAGFHHRVWINWVVFFLIFLFSLVGRQMLPTTWAIYLRWAGPRRPTSSATLPWESPTPIATPAFE